MKLLEEKSKLFNNILFVIWSLLHYYANTFGYCDLGAAHRMSCKLFRTETLTKIRITVPKVDSYNSYYKTSDMQVIMNEYLPLLLSEYAKEIPPFEAGKHYTEIMPALYMTEVVSRNGCFVFEFLYVDNMDAYRLVRSVESDKITKII